MPTIPITPPAAMAASHARFNISVIRGDQTQTLTRANRDFKPVSSLDGQTLVFFRVMTYGDGSFETWRTAICVVQTDGDNFRQLTSGQYADYNPTFLRDGTNRIAFNRYNRTGRGHSEIFLTTIDAEQGAEQRVSHPTQPAYEWVYSSLKDGRLFIHRIQSAQRETFLLTPNPGGLGTYQRVEMPSNQYFHKASISPSETKITYMYDNDNNGATYEDAQIAWASLRRPQPPRLQPETHHPPRPLLHRGIPQVEPRRVLHPLRLQQTRPRRPHPPDLRPPHRR